MATQGNTPNTTEIYTAAEVDSGFLSTAAAGDKADLVGGLVPSSQLPSYVDDVLEFANLAAFPVTGEVGKIYIALDTEKIYRWATTVYVEVGQNLSAADVKTLYESNANTNGVTDTEKTALGNLSGTNTGDQVIPATGVDFDPVGTDNSDDNAVNTLYSGLVSADGSVASHSDVSAAQATAIGNLSGTNSGDEVDASTTVKGIVEKSTSAENVAGTSDVVYPTVAGVKEMVDTHGGGGGGGSFTDNLYCDWSLVGSAASYTKVQAIRNSGTSMSTATKIFVYFLRGSTNNTVDIRIRDVTNGTTIATLLAQTALSLTELDMGTLSNLTSTPAIWELQARKGAGAGANVNITFELLSIEY